MGCRAVFGTIALAAVAAPLAAGWHSQPGPVEHAVVPVGSSSVEIWRDPGDGELALRWQGADSWTMIRGRKTFRVTQAHLAQLELFEEAADLWRPIRLQYGLTPDRTDAALRSGNRVPRPSLMDVPDLDRPARPYSYVRHFGTDVRHLRTAAGFPVPSPGARLAGFWLADALLTQTRGPGRLVDSGYLADLVYSADPSRLGTGEPLLQVEAASRGAAVDSYRRFFAASRRRLVGPGYEARATELGPILRYHGAYVLVSLRIELSPRRLRSVLAAIARS